MGFNILNKACFNWFFKPVVSLTFSFSTGLNRDLHRIGTARVADILPWVVGYWAGDVWSGFGWDEWVSPASLLGELISC